MKPPGHYLGVAHVVEHSCAPLVVPLALVLSLSLRLLLLTIVNGLINPVAGGDRGSHFTSRCARRSHGPPPPFTPACPPA